jgi:hypothetical protein
MLEAISVLRATNGGALPAPQEDVEEDDFLEEDAAGADSKVCHSGGSLKGASMDAIQGQRTAKVLQKAVSQFARKKPPPKNAILAQIQVRPPSH